MKKTVIFVAYFKVVVEAEDEESLYDTIRDIDIPEGGKHGAVYMENTFDVVEVVDGG